MLGLKFAYAPTGTESSSSTTSPAWKRERDDLPDAGRALAALLRRAQT